MRKRIQKFVGHWCDQTRKPRIGVMRNSNEPSRYSQLKPVEPWLNPSQHKHIYSEEKVRTTSTWVWSNKLESVMVAPTPFHPWSFLCKPEVYHTTNVSNNHPTHDYVLTVMVKVYILDHLNCQSSTADHAAFQTAGFKESCPRHHYCRLLFHPPVAFWAFSLDFH